VVTSFLRPAFPAAAALLLVLASSPPPPRRSSGPARGTLILDGGGAGNAVRDRFVALAGGASATIVAIPTGASSLRFGEAKTILDPDWPRERAEWKAYADYLEKWLGVSRITILHTRDRAVADSEAFVAPLRAATGVFLGPGNAGRIAVTYLDTRTQQEVEAVLARGGVVLGSSAGAIIQGSFIVRGRPDKPLLMVTGRDRGFAFLRNVVVNPHLTSAKRDSELVNVLDAHPELVGFGIDDDAALVVQGDTASVIGTGRVAVYDDKPHETGWYYWLKAGDRFDVRERRSLAAGVSSGKEAASR
jgi:cyanophycinase